jgi:IMP dehydrogenase
VLVYTIEKLIERAQEGLTFDDVLLQPQYSDIETRTKINTNSNGLIQLDLPVLSANMDTVTEDEMAIAMSKAGGAGILHRFCGPHKLSYMLDKVGDNTGFRIPSVGVAKNDPLLNMLCDKELSFICVDVAHGHHKLVVEKLSEIKKRMPLVTIIAGNVATSEGVRFLINVGANIIKVGIGGGAVCSTRTTTAHGVPQVTATYQCAETAREMGGEIICDGGIRKIGDIAIALACGASYVMIGSMLAGAPETPGDILDVDGKIVKEYRGMASFNAQQAIGKDRTPEGVSQLVPLGTSVYHKMKEIKGGLQSALSYSGARSLNEFRSKALFMRITPASFTEGTTHGLSKH